MYTYAQLLRYLEAYKQISSYTADDATKRINYFGTETYKIARIIKMLSKIEEEFIEFRNEIIKKHNPDNLPKVDDSVIAAIDKEYHILLSTKYDGLSTLPMIDYECIVGNGNKINAESLSMLMEFVENIPE